MNTLKHDITKSDRRRLGSLLVAQDSQALGERKWRARLETMLENATSVEPNHAPADLVTMNTTVAIKDLDTGNVRTVTLAYPEDTDLTPNGISVFESLGAAILGRRVGDVVKHRKGQGDRQVVVGEIFFQPERARQFHL